MPKRLIRLDKMPAASVFYYDPAHRWGYFPDVIYRKAFYVKLRVNRS